MSLKRYVPIVLLLLVLGSCSAPDESVPPTPFPTAGAAVTVTLDQGTLAPTIGEVLSSLALYENASLQITGRLRRQPLLVCDSDPHFSPATWSLSENGAMLLAAGFDQQVRTLLPEDLTMTVEGRLRRWEGLVGCGKQAQPQEVWYLETARVLSPSPLTQATLTPEGIAMGGGEQPEATSTEAAGETLAPTDAPTLEATPESGDSQPTPTRAAPTAPPAQPTTAEVTPTQSGAAQLTPTATAAGTVTATATISATPGTVTPSPTPGQNGATPTASSGLATATTAAGQVIDKGSVDDIEEEFPADFLGTGDIHSWTLEVFEGESYDVSVIAPIPADIVLSLYRDGQPLVDRQNQSPAGSAEILSIVNQTTDGVYEIRVQTVSGTPAEYILVLSIPGDYEIELLGFLTSGSPRSNVTLTAESLHFWNFMAAAGNRITITLTPSGQSDGYLYVYGPGAVYVTDADEGSSGEEEVLEYTIEDDGLHTIEVGDAEGERMVYTIVLTIQQ